MALKKLREINSRANAGIRQKIKNAKEDPRHLGLVFLEFMLVTIILVSLLFLFDPNLSFPESNLIPWPIKLVLFAVAVFVAFKLYSLTKDFRLKSD